MNDLKTDKDVGTASKDWLGVEEIMERIPHRYPFLMIDRLENILIDDSAVGVKNVTYNEPFFPGHFPGRPVMPGVLIIEAMAQTAGVLVEETMAQTQRLSASQIDKIRKAGRVVYFMTIDEARFRRPVVPGDRLELHMKKMRNRGPVWKFTGTAKVAGAVVAQAVISAMIIDAPS